MNRTRISFLIPYYKENYALVNYQEIIDWYKQPFLKRLFKTKPRYIFILIDND